MPVNFDYMLQMSAGFSDFLLIPNLLSAAIATNVQSRIQEAYYRLVAFFFYVHIQAFMSAMVRQPIHTWPSEEGGKRAARHQVERRSDCPEECEDVARHLQEG